eukprot:g2036.t1
MTTPLLSIAFSVIRNSVLFLASLRPVIAKVYGVVQDVRAQLAPYNVEQYFMLVVGLVMVFFGGFFSNLIAVYTVFQLIAWEDTKGAFSEMLNNAKVAMEAVNKDEKVDANKDGVADSKQMGDAEWANHKLLVIAKAVDPSSLQTAVGSIWSGFIAVYAALRLRFARAITFGCSIGRKIALPLKANLMPAMISEVQPEYRKWVPVFIDQSCHFLGVMLSFTLLRIINAFNSSVQGGHIVFYELAKIGRDQNIEVLTQIFDGPHKEILAWCLTGVGFAWQLSHRMSLPWWLSLPLFPLSLLDGSVGLFFGTTF